MIRNRNSATKKLRVPSISRPKLLKNLFLSLSLIINSPDSHSFPPIFTAMEQNNDAPQMLLKIKRKRNEEPLDVLRKSVKVGRSVVANHTVIIHSGPA